MNKKILIVDDSFSDLEIMKNLLTKEKYDISTVTNGAQAIDITSGIKFDLIILDIKMPTLSGYDLSRLLRDRFGNKSKLVYVTIVPKNEVDLENVDGFIQKPFSNKSLIGGIKKVLK